MQAEPGVRPMQVMGGLLELARLKVECIHRGAGRKGRSVFLGRSLGGKFSSRSARKEISLPTKLAFVDGVSRPLLL